MPKKSGFFYSQDNLREMTAKLMALARDKGASACEAEVSEGFGLSVTVRKKEIETIEHNRDKGLSLTVFVGQRKGSAGTSDFSPIAMEEAVMAAVSIARNTAADEYAGLPEKELLAREFPDLDLFHPWSLQVERAVELARECEAAAFAMDKRVSNSEGASVTTQQSHFVYGNSLGFMAGYPTSRHGVACSVIAGKGSRMQRDDWYTTSRVPTHLESPASVGKKAATRCVKRLGAKKIATVEAKVLFEAPVASGFFGHFVAAASGGNLYRKSSFLVDRLDSQIFSSHLTIREAPFLPAGLASSAFDGEGVAAQERDVVSDGILKGYFLSSYSARKLNMRPTGNAGGNHNLLIKGRTLSFEPLLREMGTGILVTELLGQGVNVVTGDYSRGAAGFWVENGEIAYPVEETTIAGNLKDMFKSIVAIGDDVVIRGSVQCGSVLVEGMTIAGE
ncbi:MAG: metalloprotease PmbA [Burkholderiales bacterium]